MSDRPTWLLLSVLLGCVVSYVLIRRVVLQPSPHQPRPRTSTISPQTSRPQTSPAPTTSVSLHSSTARLTLPTSLPIPRGSLQQPLLDLRRIRLSPEHGLIAKHQLLPVAVVQQIMGIRIPLRRVFLQGIPRSREYDALQYVWPPQHRRTSYALGLQVWMEPHTQLRHRWNQQMQTYPQVKPLSSFKSGAQQWHMFRAYRNNIHYLNGYTSQGIFSLSCHQNYCNNGQFLLPLAHHIEQKLSK